ncbi:hypothetical protein C0J52_16906 [Blattella germanica]|nr:hypothetical protein C0J52_16906 [Blattella germanica]
MCIEDNTRGYIEELRKSGDLQTMELKRSIAKRLTGKFPIISELTPMLTGYGRIRNHVHRFCITPDATCPCTRSDQTVDHILLECPKYDMERQDLRRSKITKGGACHRIEYT